MKQNTVFAVRPDGNVVLITINGFSTHQAGLDTTVFIKIHQVVNNRKWFCEVFMNKISRSGWSVVGCKHRRCLQITVVQLHTHSQKGFPKVQH